MYFVVVTCTWNNIDFFWFSEYNSTVIKNTWQITLKCPIFKLNYGAALPDFTLQLPLKSSTLKCRSKPLYIRLRCVASTDVYHRPSQRTAADIFMWQRLFSASRIAMHIMVFLIHRHINCTYLPPQINLFYCLLWQICKVYPIYQLKSRSMNGCNIVFTRCVSHKHSSNTKYIPTRIHRNTK